MQVPDQSRCVFRPQGQLGEGGFLPRVGADVDVRTAHREGQRSIFSPGRVAIAFCTTSWVSVDAKVSMKS